MCLGQSPVLPQECVPTGGIPEALALPALRSGEQLSRWGLGVQRSRGCKRPAHYLTEFRGEGKTSLGESGEWKSKCLVS